MQYQPCTDAGQLPRHPLGLPPRLLAALLIVLVLWQVAGWRFSLPFSVESKSDLPSQSTRKEPKVCDVPFYTFTERQDLVSVCWQLIQHNAQTDCGTRHCD
jgi:hypothetical protein